MYGLKQTPRAWYTRIDGYFHNSGFQRSKSEPILYYKKQGEDILRVCLYVHDLIYMGSNSELIDEFKAAMMKEFEMDDFGLMHYLLGMKVHQNSDEIFICQTKYAKDMLKKFGMVDCKPVSTPIAHGELLYKNDGIEKTNKTEFRSIVGSLMFLTNIRPDIGYAVLLVSRYMCEPFVLHLRATKRILRVCERHH